MNKNNFFVLFLVLLLTALILLPSGGEPKKQLAVLKDPVAEILPPPPVEAESALAYDITSGKIFFEKNKTDSHPLASLTKIISSLVFLDKLGAEEEVEISKHAVLTEGLSGLYVGDHFRVRDLLAFVMVESSNDAVEALVEHLAKKNGVAPDTADEWFLNFMRDKAQSLGAPAMMFYNPTGLDIEPKKQAGLPAEALAKAGAYGSAEDLMSIIKTSLDSELWQFGSVTEVTSLEGKAYTLKSTNILKNELNLLIGGKTGFTDLAGGNLLVIVQYPLGHPIGIVVLGSSEQGRFTDVKAIFDWIKSQK